jgi:hypothetical protein
MSFHQLLGSFAPREVSAAVHSERVKSFQKESGSLHRTFCPLQQT